MPPNLSPNTTLFDHGPPEIADKSPCWISFAKIKLVNQAWVKPAPKYSHLVKDILHFAERMNNLTRRAGKD